jgi:hypothetical protein
MVIRKVAEYFTSTGLVFSGWALGGARLALWASAGTLTRTTGINKVAIDPFITVDRPPENCAWLLVERFALLNPGSGA